MKLFSYSLCLKEIYFIDKFDREDRIIVKTKNKPLAILRRRGLSVEFCFICFARKMIFINYTHSIDRNTLSKNLRRAQKLSTNSMNKSSFSMKTRFKYRIIKKNREDANFFLIPS